MRKDLLGLLDEFDDLTHVMILTYGLDFIFLERVVLPKLVRAGNPTITIFADAHRAQHAFRQVAELITGLGKRYRLVPVLMPGNGCFHPKAVLLAGKQRGILLVGSGNLGVGGWRENGEIWTQYDTEQNGSAAISAFQQYLEQIVSFLPPNETLRQEIASAFYQDIHPWAQEMAPPDYLLGWFKEGPSLVRQLEAALPEGDFEELVVCSPFFDEGATALAELRKQFPSKTTRLFIQPVWSQLSAEAAAELPSEVTIQAVTFKKAKENVGYLHAKFYAFHKQERVWLVSGSANCSRAALLGGGNAELVAIQVLPIGEYEQTIAAELAEIGDPLSLPSREEQRKSDNPLPKLALVGCRFDGTLLQANYYPAAAPIEECRVDGKTCPFVVLEPGALCIRDLENPRIVVVLGTVDGAKWVSYPCWVDYEHELSKTSTERNVGAGIQRMIQPAEWSCEAWIEILRLLKDHLEQIPVVQKMPTPPSHEDTESIQGLVRPEQIFESPMVVPRFHLREMATGMSPAGRVDGLRGVLLRWYGLNTAEEDDFFYQPSEEERIVQLQNSTLAESSKAKDKPDIKQQGVSTKTFHRIKKLTNEIVDRMTEIDHVNARSMEQLAQDWAVVGILLATGRGEGWLSQEEYLQLSQRLWTHAFLDSGSSMAKSSGSLLIRHDEDPPKFEREFYSTDLTAVLLTWAWLGLNAEPSPRRSRFLLTAITAIRLLPSLWGFDCDIDLLSQRLRQLFLAVGALSPTDRPELPATKVSNFLENLLKWGVALGRFETCLKSIDIAKIRFPEASIQLGELLWQKGAGFCIVSAWSGPQRCEVLVLQSEDSKKYAADYLRPVRLLLEIIDSANNSFLTADELDSIRNLVEFLQSWSDQLQNGLNE